MRLGNLEEAKQSAIKLKAFTNWETYTEVLILLEEKINPPVQENNDKTESIDITKSVIIDEKEASKIYEEIETKIQGKNTSNSIVSKKFMYGIMVLGTIAAFGIKYFFGKR